MPELLARLDKLIAKCTKKGLEGSIVVKQGEMVMRTEQCTDSFGRECVTSTWWIPVTLECNPPKLNGWEFAATIEQIDGSPTHLLRCSPAYEGGKIPAHFRDCDPTYCEHCKKRRNRSETFVVFNAERVDFRQVGRQCLRDFLGHDPSMMIASAGYIAEAVDAVSECASEGGGFRNERAWPIDYILSLTARVVAIDGWKPRAFEEKSTASNLMHYLFLGQSANDRIDAYRFAETYPDSPKSASLLARTMARVDELKAMNPATLTSDYEINLWTLLKSGTCRAGHIGLVASMLAYAVKQENEAAAAKGDETSGSVHVGTIGERIRNVSATVVYTRTFEGQYGSTTLIKFNAGGNLLSWFATGFQELAAGDEVTITGTVKAHEDDKYLHRPVTLLSRCKVQKMTVAA